MNNNEMESVARQAISVLSLTSESAINGQTVVQANNYLQKYFEINHELISGIKVVDEGETR